MRYRSSLQRRLTTAALAVSMVASTSALLAADGSAETARAASNSNSGSKSDSGQSSSSSSSSSSSGVDDKGGSSSSGSSSSSSGVDDKGGSSSSGSSSSSSGVDDKGGLSRATASTDVKIQGKSTALIAGFPAEFSITFEKRFDRAKFKAEVSNLNVSAGTGLLVCQGPKAMGTLTVGALKLGEMELDSRLGASIPTFVGGEEFTLVGGNCAAPALMKATLASGVVSALGVAVVQNDSLIEGSVRKIIQGFEAKFDVRLETRADRNKFYAQVEGLNLGSGTRLDVCFANAFLGDLFLNALNLGSLELDSRFPGVSVPTLKAGDVIELRQGGCGGVVVMTATMGGSSSVADSSQVLRSSLTGVTKKEFGSFETEFKVQFDRLGDRRKVEAEVANMNLPESTHLTVCMAGNALGDVVLNTIHYGQFELDTRNGAVVPEAKVGDLVELHRQGCSSELLLSVSLTLAP